ncbi:hypothetical protein KJ909_01505 [Patescibacteria group bacterium]|nr:hypothetical protein [Patescibacteria group bacterium]
MNLLKTLNQSNYNFFFPVVDPFLDIKIPQLKNFYSLKNPSLKNSGQLLSSPATLKFIKQTCQQNQKKPAIVFFKPSKKIDYLCQKNHWLPIGNSASLSRTLEDKIKFSLLCLHYQIPHPPYHLEVFNQQTYQKYKPLLKKIVIQTRFGWAGKSSFLSSRFSDVKNKIIPNTPVKYSPYLKNAKTLINNCCLTSQGLIQSPLALQINGLHFLSSNPLATTGRQWPCSASPQIKKQIKHLTLKFSRILQQKKYLGFFGLDFLIDKDKVYLQECNPRLTASFAFYHQLETTTPYTPLFLLHLASFLKLDHKIDINFENKRFFSSKIVGFQLNSKNSKGQTLRQISQNRNLKLTPKTVKTLFQNASQN